MTPSHGRGCNRLTMWGLALLIIASPVAAWAQAADSTSAPLDLGTVLDLAGAGSRAAAQAGSDLDAAEAVIRKAKANWWPSVDLDAKYLVHDNAIEAQAGAFRFPTSEKASGQYELSARELLFDGGRRGLAVTQAERQADAVRSAGRADVQQTQLDAMDAFLTALELAGRRHVLEQRLAALKAHQKVVSDLYDHGLTARNDVLETGVRVREVEDRIAAVQNQREVAARDLNRKLGRDPQPSPTLPDSLPPPPPLSADRQTLLADATQENARVRAAADRLAASRATVNLARRMWIPSLFVGASHAFQENQYLVHQFVNTIMAGVSWNVFDGGARSADVMRAEAGATAAVRDQVEVQRAVAVAVDAAWMSWDQTRREERTARANVDAARENLRIVEDQYQNGVARSSDVLEAEALLAQSRFDVITRYYATYRAQADLLVAAGRDLVAFYGGAGSGAGEH